MTNDQARPKLVPKFKDFSFSLKAAIAEFFAMTLFVYTGTASAVFFSPNAVVGGKSNWESATLSTVGSNTYKAAGGLSALQLTGSWGIVVALTFGLAIAVLAYAIAHVSGGQLNPCVSFALFATGHMGPVQMFGNMIAQFVGAILGSACLYGTTPNASDSLLGSNSVNPNFTTGQAIMGEAVMTCVLIFTVLQTACEPRSMAKNMAPLAIGLSVFMGHAVLLNVDGCSINPARSFGPALISGNLGSGDTTNYWLFFVAPFIGSLFGIMCHLIMYFDWDAKFTQWGKKVVPGGNKVSNDNCGLNDEALRFR